MKTFHRFLLTLTLVSFLCPARAQSPFDRALALDGVSQYVAVPAAAASAISNAFTIEAWVNLQAYNHWSRLIDFGNGPAADNLVCALSAGDSGQPNFTFYRPDNQNFTAPNPLPLNVWTHVAFTYDGTNGSIYVNGALAARGAMLPPRSATRTQNYIGRSDWAGDGYTQAFIDDFRIWKLARTQAQIQAQLNAPLHGTETGLLLYYRFDSTNGVVATNSAVATGAAFNGTLVNGPTLVDSGLLTVSNTADSGLGSLRQVIAGAPAGAFVSFATNLSGQTIRLTSGEIALNQSVTIDSSASAKRILLNGNHSNRIFSIISNATVTLNSLILTNGNGGGSAGGAIVNSGNLTLNQCTVVSNTTTGSGGAVFNLGGLTVNACTFLGNIANSLVTAGGGIDNFGNLTVRQSTFVGNAANGGGAIFTEGGSLLTVIQSTICSNTAFCCGGGITVYATSGTQTLLNSIVAGNSAGDLYYGSGPGFTVMDSNLANTNPLLMPLGNYGGPTQTMPPKTNSTAIDHGNDDFASSFATDQRGLPRLFGLHVDIGAVEAIYPIPAPTAVTLPATQQAETTATLNGTVSGQHTVTTCYFQYGTTISYGSNTPSSIVVDGLNVLTHAALTGLSPTTFYHCRLVASNSVKTVFGSDVTFHTAGVTNLVTSASDDGSAGTLRAVVANDASGDLIRFAPALSGQSIRLVKGQIVLNNNVSIDGSTLARAVSLNGNHSNRIFQVNGGVTVTLNSLAMTNGFASPGPVAGALVANAVGHQNANNQGGAVNNFGTLAIINSTLAGNSANAVGGAIANNGRLTLTGCTLAGNSASEGGAVDSRLSSACAFYNCTFFGNRAGFVGGAFYDEYNVTSSIMNCTICGNSAGSGGYGGGLAVYHGAVRFTNTIIAGNGGGDVYLFGNATVTAGGANIVQSITDNATVLGGDTILPVDPKLAVLGNHGGATQTMPPLAGSPAIDNGDDSATNSLATDQRGQPRLFGLHVDIGAVESVYTPAAPSVVTLPASDQQATTVVLNGTVARNGRVPTAYYFQYGTTTAYGLATATNVLNPGAVLVSVPITSLSPATFFHCRLVATNPLGRTLGNDMIFHTGSATNLVTNAKDDGSAGSLRTVVANAAFGDFIHFAANLSAQTILLTNGLVTVNNNLTIDASALTNRVLINGNDKSCIFQVSSNATAVFDSLVITNGYNSESALPFSGVGGGINNEGTVTVNHCLFTRNGSDAEAGGIYNLGTMTINNCALLRNYTYSDGRGGGAIQNDGTMTINNTTLSGNQAYGGDGGAIVNTALLTVNNSTVATNRADGDGGGIFNNHTLNLTNTIVAGNSAPADLSGSSAGANNLVGGDPMLAPLGNYGGADQTMPPLPGSPAIDAGTDAVTSFLATDQRGQPRLIGAHVDIGAVEANPMMLIVLVSGNGKVTPDYNGQLLTAGNAYSMTAAASPTFTFTNWTGGTNFPLASLTNHATLKFVMQPNLVLQANILDLTKPTLLITNLPASGGRVSNSVFAVKGWARDNAGVANVFYRLTNTLSDTGWLAATSANNFTNWVANLNLNPGTNTVLAYALDNSGNLSATNVIKFAANFVPPPLASLVNDDSAAQPQVISLTPITITGATKLGNDTFAFTFTGQPYGNYQVIATTDLGLPSREWTPLGSAVETPAGSGQYQFTDSQASDAQRFYRVSTP